MGEAAQAIGVSVDTLRRWDREGLMDTRRDARNRRRVSVEEVQRLRRVPGRHRAGGRLSARNRLAGRVASVEVDGVMALVEIQVGSDRITAAITRDSVEEPGLLEGQRVFARVKATDVMVEHDEE
jgi:molybdopterin-binding protein